MGIEHEPSSEEAEVEVDPAVLEEFKNELEATIEEIEDGEETSIPLQALPSYWELESSKEVLIKAVMEKLGVNPDAAQPVRQYTITDSPEKETVGDIEVKVFATNNSGVFLGKYTDSNGDTDWTIRPLEGEE
jgi:hypothetical protein